MNIKPESEIISEEEINLYDYWKVLVKWKKIFIGVFLVPLVIVTIISLSIPRYYRGESEIGFTALPASKIVNLVGDINDIQKVKIFTKNPGAIKNAFLSLPKKSTDKVNIIIDANTADIIPQASKELFYYIANLPETKLVLAKIRTETDFKIKSLIEAKNANLIFLNQITDMMKKRQLSFINVVNPADLIQKDTNLSLEIMNLQDIKVIPGILGPLSITKRPSNSQIEQWIFIVGLLSFFAGLFVVFFLEYIDRIKARENK